MFYKYSTKKIWYVVKIKIQVLRFILQNLKVNISFFSLYFIFTWPRRNHSTLILSLCSNNYVIYLAKPEVMESIMKGFNRFLENKRTEDYIANCLRKIQCRIAFKLMLEQNNSLLKKIKIK